MDPRGNKQEDISFSACPQLLVTKQPPQPSPDMWGIPRGTEGRREEEVGELSGILGAAATGQHRPQDPRPLKTEAALGGR